MKVFPVSEYAADKNGMAVIFPISLYIPDKIGVDAAAVYSVCTDAFIPVESPNLSCLVFEKDDSVRAQGYKIRAEKGSLTVFFSNGAGAFYALVTLWQIYKTKGTAVFYEIEDAPCIPNRGFMLDISRGKVPTVNTVKKLADLLAQFKYNQLQLYIEGFSFVYSSFADYCNENSALTSDEIRELDSYCRARFIELVPNQNSLGHMASWLAKPEIAGLAECEGGFSYGGFTVPPTTLDPDDPKALAFVDTLMNDLLMCFSSKKFHAGLDEPFELGRGKSKDKDLKQLFLNYIKKLNTMTNSYGKEMMIWADAAHRFGCTDAKLPNNIIFMEWGYEKEYPFSKRCKALHDARKRFYVCPGTSSWLSFLGLTDCMLKNIDNAVNAGVQYGAEGVLLTDWGDGNHMQYLPVSYPAIIYCGTKAWNPHADFSECDLAYFLDTLVFEDESRVMGKLALNAGKYHLYEEFLLPCRTIAYTIYQSGIDSTEKFAREIKITAMLLKAMAAPEVASAYSFEKAEIDTDKTEKTVCFLQSLKTRLRSVRMYCKDSDLVTEEYDNALETVILFTRLRQCFFENRDTAYLNERIKTVAERHERLWLARNKQSGLDTAVSQMLKFVK